MTYTLTAYPNTIVRDEDQAFIPTDPDNTDYQKYLKWLDEGNEPTPYTPPEPPPEARAEREGKDHGDTSRKTATVSVKAQSTTRHPSK